MIDIVTATKHHPALSPELLDSMYRLRSAAFFDRLRWQVTSEGGREIDWFDHLDPTYMIARRRERSGTALGCWRLLPSTGPTMLRDVFPELLHGIAAPSDASIWEISRFAVAADDADKASGFGFNGVSVSLWRHLLGFARARDIDGFVAVTTVAVERLVRKLGLTIERFGPPMRIGEVMSVAFHLPMDARAEAALWPDGVDPYALAQIAATAGSEAA